jgi:hypothetical protein
MKLAVGGTGEVEREGGAWEGWTPTTISADLRKSRFLPGETGAGDGSALLGGMGERPLAPEGSGAVTLRVPLRPIVAPAVRRFAIACTMGSDSSPTFVAVRWSLGVSPTNSCWVGDVEGTLPAGCRVFAVGEELGVIPLIGPLPILLPFVAGA